MTGVGERGPATARDRLAEIRDDPVGFCRRGLGFEPWSRQREILEAVRDFDRVAVRSANAVGKTSIAARAALCWLAGGEGSVVVTTAPTWRQVTHQLWREVARGHRAAAGFFRGAELTGTRLELGPHWFAVGLSADEPETWQGWHAERLLVIVDEASGVSEAIFEAVEGVLAGGEAKVLLLGNPTRLAGQFYRAFHSEREFWRTLSVSAFDTPAFTGEPVSEAALRGLVTRRWVEERRRAWGESSPLWQVRVLGEFASTADDTLCALADVEAAQTRRLPPDGEDAVVACDCARFGSDETIIAVRFGPRVRIAAAYAGRDLMRTVGEILRVARRVRAETHTAPVLVVDDVGLGGGVTDRLREVDEFQVVAFNGGEQAHDPSEYPNRRSEAWFGVAERLGELDLPADERLAADLVAPRYGIDSRGRRVVEPKAETKKRLGRSPDRGDAVVLACAVRGRASYAVASPLPLQQDWLRRLGPPAGVLHGEGDGSLTGDLLERLL